MTCPVVSLDGAGWPILPLVSLAFFVAACIPIGPNSVKSDQVDYADAISEASKRLTLTNIVKTRYGDAPSYLVASQVVAGYQLQANVAADLDLVRQGGWELGDSGTLTIGGQFSNSPTLTYTPVAGADFSALLLQPIAPADVYALIGGGTPPARVEYFSAHPPGLLCYRLLSWPLVLDRGHRPTIKTGVQFRDRAVAAGADDHRAELTYRHHSRRRSWRCRGLISLPKR